MKDIKEMSFAETMKDMPNRILTMVWKLLSIKGIALALAVFIITKGILSGWEAVTLFILTVLMVVGGREADKWKNYFIDMKDGRKDE